MLHRADTQPLDRLAVRVPEGMVPGQAIAFPTPSGQQYQAVIPAGVKPGQIFVVLVPSTPSQSLPMGLPVESSPAPAPAASPPARAAAIAPPARLLRAGSAVHEIVAPAWRDGQALKHAECPICFEPLHASPVGVFLDEKGKRVSPHFFNLAAAREWLGTGNGRCPLTRQRIASVAPVPDLRHDPKGWWRVVDVDGDGKLSRHEVLEAIKAQLPVDTDKIDEAMADPQHWMWEQWDKDRSGFIEESEALQTGGLLDFVREVFAMSESRPDSIPDMRHDKDGWYRYWDEDGDGSLDREEVLRALLKTLKLTTDPARVHQMRETISEIWPIFDTDGSGAIDREEFLRPSDGLADTIIATMGT